METSSHTPARNLAVGLLLLTGFAVFLAHSWQAWGHLTVDHGREMFVPERLSWGDLLYEDVRYPYGPLIPYAHALAYRFWQPHLDVLYVSGILGTAIVVVSLYSVALRVGSLLAAGLATALAMVDVMMRPVGPGFSMVAPYAYPATWGLAFLVTALAAALRGIDKPTVARGLVAGGAVGLALLTKHEFGVIGLGLMVITCIGSVLVSGAPISRSFIAAFVGSGIGLAFVGWGMMAMWVTPSTIIHKGLFAEEYFGWPLTWSIAGLVPGLEWHQMLLRVLQLYGKSAHLWLVVLAFAGAAGLLAARRSAGEDVPVRLSPGRARGLGLLALAWAAWACWELSSRGFAPHADIGPQRLRYAALPGLLLLWLVVIVPGLARDAWQRRPVSAGRVRRAILVAVALALLARVPAKAFSGNYGNFFLGPGIILLVCLAIDRFPRVVRGIGGDPRVARGAMTVIVAALGVLLAVVRWESFSLRTDVLATPRGTLRFLAGDPYPTAFREALDLIDAETEPGDTILAIPTETSLYFLGSRPNRLFAPHLVAELVDVEGERAYIRDLERDPPALVLTSSQSLAEYGRGYFGYDYGRWVYRWLRAGYEPQGVVGVPPIQITWWKPRAEGGGATADRHASVHDVVYAERGGRELRLDVHRPRDAAGPLPALVFFHGGGWAFGDKSDAFPDEATFWASQGPRRWPSMAAYLDFGMAVVSVEYRLSNEAKAPAAIEDAITAIDWLGEHGREYGIDPSRLVTIGPSAGGHLALMAAYSYRREDYRPLPVREQPAPEIRGAISLYGPTSLVPFLRQQKKWRREWSVDWTGDGPEGLFMAQFVSPIASVHAEIPPALLIHGDTDKVVPHGHSRALQKEVETAGGRAELLTLEGAVHGFLNESEQRRVTTRIIGFLQELGLVPPS